MVSVLPPIGAGQTVSSHFQNVRVQKTQFDIHPDWVSEGFTEHKIRNMQSRPPGRSYKPWAYEFQGARHWPISSEAEKTRYQDQLYRPTGRAEFRRSGSQPSWPVDYHYDEGETRYLNRDTFVRRPGSALNTAGLGQYARDVLHPSTVMRLSDPGLRPDRDGAGRRWASYQGKPNYSQAHYTYDNGYVTNYGERFNKYNMDPQYSEYFEDDHIPPSRGVTYSEHPKTIDHTPRWALETIPLPNPKSSFQNRCVNFGGGLLGQRPPPQARAQYMNFVNLSYIQ